MNLSVNTVKFHIKNIYDKLEVHSRSELLIKLSNL
ncbi:MAG: response regulator transcription factor [Saprospiraceae bacterium]|nr:response regulator transcription factor [Saprospiraceae bacterium]